MRTVLLAAAIFVGVPGVSAQQHNIDTQKSTLTIHVKTTIATGVSADPKVDSRWSVLICVIETFFSNSREAIGLSVFFNEATHEGDYRQSHHK